MSNLNSGDAISIIIPFYKGNDYVEKLIRNIAEIRKVSKANITNIIFVNDSPWEAIILPELSENFPIAITVLKNKQNCGIQRSRVNGLNICETPLFIFLDQDDALIPEGFNEQIELIQNADVVVGNGLYQYGDKYKSIYKNKKVMEYLIQKKRFIEIRNLIPSPGCCLFRKESIPIEWKNSCMKVNGADDWYLWLLMFSLGKRFSVNSGMVYQHNSTDAGNLSADLEKMHDSSIEMFEKLQEDSIFVQDELKTLKSAIEFKYLQDTRKLTPISCLKYYGAIRNNISYKVHLALL